MRLITTIASLVIIMAASLGQAQNTLPSSNGRAEALHLYKLDPATALHLRVRQTPVAVLQMFHENGMSPKERVLTEEESKKVSNAFNGLPPLHKHILKDRLLSISFLDDMPNTALTSTLNPNDSYKLFHITFRAEILNQDVSEWLTEKERTCFDTVNSNLKVNIHAGHLDAFVYVLLHESTHIVDAALNITPHNYLYNGQDVPDSLVTDFIASVWRQRTVVSSTLKSTLLDSISFRRGGKKLPPEKAKDVYEALKQTPFVSLYGRNSWHEDLAEYVTVYHLTEKLGQPFTIIIRNNGKEIFSYNPMMSALVRNRIIQMSRFYKT